MRVVWSFKALQTYFTIVDYLKNEWGDNIAENFIIKVEKVIDEIRQNPYMFEASKKYKNVRKGFLDKHNLLFYRVKPRKEIIELLIFWDTRQDDKKIRY